MENNQEFLPQLETLILTGEDANIELALEIANSMGLTEELMQPWRKFWDNYSKWKFSNKALLLKLAQWNRIKRIKVEQDVRINRIKFIKWSIHDLKNFNVCDML
jgi:hypothetical protein